MTLATSKQVALSDSQEPFAFYRLLLPVALVMLLINTSTRQLTINVLSDAFWQVSVFVAMTLAVYHSVASYLLKAKLAVGLLNNGRLQVVFASLMGMIPGCGGAIIVITQYVNGAFSFGSVVAVLTATMGDAAFILLLGEFSTGITVLIICFLVGVVSGITIDAIHGLDFLRPQTKVDENCQSKKNTLSKVPLGLSLQSNLWRAIMFPCVVIGLLMAAQVDISLVMSSEGDVLPILGAVTVVLFIVLWALTTEVHNFSSIVSEDSKSQTTNVFHKVALDTNFVTSWVVVAFLSFELLVHFTQLDLQNVFSFTPALAPLIGVVVGMIPGCGPQILVTTMYLSGAIPLSAQLANSIGNDGDALFPAIAMSPKVALLATLYSAIPALVVAYGYFLWFE